MIRFVFAVCLVLELCACSTMSSAGKSVDSFFDRNYKVRETNSDYVIIEYEMDHFSEEQMLQKADGTCNVWAKTAVFNRSMIDPTTGRRVTTYRCLTQTERRVREEAQKAGEPVPLRP